MLLVTGFAARGKGKSDKEIEDCLHNRTGLDVNMYGETDLFYIGEMDKSSAVESVVEDSKRLYKYGISIQGDTRELTHRANKSFSNFRYIYLKPCVNGPMKAKLEKRVRDIVQRNHLSIRISKHQECFTANEQELQFIQNEIDKSDDMYLQAHTYQGMESSSLCYNGTASEPCTLIDRPKTRYDNDGEVFALFRDERLSFEEMKELLACLSA